MKVSCVQTGQQKQLAAQQQVGELVVSCLLSTQAALIKAYRNPDGLDWSGWSKEGHTIT